MRRYPKIRQIHKKLKNVSAKCRCGELGKFKSIIQFNEFAGDDDVVWSCKEHKQDAEFLIISYLSIENNHE